VVTRTLRQVRQAVGSRVAVLGFAGAPLTLATYAIEGESNKDRPRFCAVLRDDPDLLISIMEKLSPVIAAYLAEQARHTDAVQLFESHANLLSAGDYEKLALPWLRRTIELFREQAPETPLLLFAQGMGNIAGCVSSLDVDGYSMDQHMSLATATDIFRAASRQAVLQGNIDPDLLCRPADEVTAYTTEFLRESSDALGHPPGAGLPKGWIVNLGHGIKPQAQPDSALALVNAVHAFTNT
jgi:uroporphyrinogen decarboxylase